MRALFLTLVALILVVACDDSSTLDASPGADAGDALDGGAPTMDAGEREDDAGGSRDAGLDSGPLQNDAGRADGGTVADAGGADGGGSDCMSRCVVRARVCGAPDATARMECARICAAAPTAGQLSCLETLSCAAAACTFPGLPCGIGTTARVPVSECEITCRATATRCGAPSDVAAARCAAVCPLVSAEQQVACVRDADCAVLACIDMEGHHPCGVANGAPR